MIPLAALKADFARMEVPPISISGVLAAVAAAITLEAGIETLFATGDKRLAVLATAQADRVSRNNLNSGHARCECNEIMSLT